MIPRPNKRPLSDNDVMMYVAVAVKHLRLMVLLVCLSLMVGLVYYTYARPIYYSKALVRMTVIPRPMDSQEVFRDSSEFTVLTEITAPNVIERAARRFGVNGNRRYIELKYLKQVRPGFDSARNLTIEVYTYSAEWATNFPAAMVQEYLDWREERRMDRMQATFQSYTNSMKRAKNNIDEVFARKAEMHDSNDLTKIEIDLNEYSDVPRKLKTVQQQLDIMDHTRVLLDSPDHNTTVEKLSLLAADERDRQATELIARQTIPPIGVGLVLPREDTNGIVVTPPLISSQVRQPWEDLAKDQLSMNEQIQALGNKGYGPRHPLMAAAKKKLDTVNEKLDLELKAAMNSFNFDYVKLVDDQQELRNKLPMYVTQTHLYAKALQDNRYFDAGQVAWENVYSYMSRTLQAMDYAAFEERVQLQYMGLVETRDHPVAPNRLKLAIYFLLLGIALAIAVPYLLEYLDSRVSDTEQVEEALHIRSLGIVPRVTDEPMDQLMLTQGTSKSDHHIQENFRLIRTNLLMNSGTPALPQVILITSAMPQEGKTVVAANLAVSFAKKGEKTLLIDSDLRRGRLHRLFACQNRPGLSEVLTQDKPLEEACRIVGNGSINGNLTLLTCGKHIHYASELLDSDVFPKIIDGLRQKYQRILIDTPPVLGLSETSIIQRSADGVLLVIWSEYTPLRNVKTAIQTLQTNGAKFSGFVLNRLDFRALANRYKYFYYSPYYYAGYKPTETVPPPELPSPES